MMLNEAIKRHQGVAKEVHLAAALNPKDGPIKIASRHQLALELDSARHRIAWRKPASTCEASKAFR